MFTHVKEWSETVVIGIANQERVQTLETKKKLKYYLLGKSLGSEDGCRIWITPYPYVVTGMGRLESITKHYKKLF